MSLKNIKIGTQLKTGFAILLTFVVTLGIVSYFQSDKIQQQTENIYNHPLMVQRTIGSLRVDVLTIQRDMKDLFLTTDEMLITRDINEIELMKTGAFEQVDVLYNRYLGPRADVDSLKHALVVWNSLHDETLRLFHTGKTADAIARTRSNGVSANQIEVILRALKKVDEFAQYKAAALFEASDKLSDTLNRQLFLIVAAILLLSLILGSVILRNIRKPLAELTQVANRFHGGDMSIRSSYHSNNEIGVLSASFNTLAKSIQVKTDLDKKFESLAALMLSEYDAKKFFQATLSALATHTGSQMAAIYLLSDDRKTFEHFESIGIDNNARQSFAAGNFEGEFGAVLSTRKVNHMKSIPQDTRFVFHTVTGKFIPHEIITLPILADNEVVAIISLASVTAYSPQAIQLVDNILVTLCARIEGILAYHRIKQFSEKIDGQYRELEAQKTELAAQAAALTEQNTELEMQKVQLGEASQLKTNFLSNMSHELRTPLNSVIALTGVLSRRLAAKIPDEEYSYLEVIERNGRHLLDLINDILDISRIEAGREEIDITRFDPNLLVADVVNMISPQAHLKNVELLATVFDTGYTITSDADKCRHILQNLIGNAVKFTESGRVVVTVQRNDNNIEITVTDTGIGISAQDIPHIFDEFRQADGSTSRRFGGSGLGLAIAKKYANLLGGAITVSSIPGSGSAFTLTLPVNYGDEKRVAEVPSMTAVRKTEQGWKPAPVPGSAVKTILLVDDSEPAIIQIQDILAGSGHTILVARDGEEALGIIASTIPDAMILDLMMPGTDGFEVLRRVREQEATSGIPVLILTAKHITKEELGFLKRNNIHQLIRKGNVNRSELFGAVTAMVQPEKPAIPAPVSRLQPDGETPVILIVEDDPDNMVTFKALLKGHFTVLEARDGVEGIEMARRHRPNLILMDIALPGIDGIEAFTTIRRDPQLQQIPVIALTASAMTTDRETILSHGFDGYLPKPIEVTLFFDKINETLYGK
ncbi:MAG: response regulator [Bacteroidota bacterium]